jgi:hypothetical protein
VASVAMVAPAETVAASSDPDVRHLCQTTASRAHPKAFIANTDRTTARAEIRRPIARTALGRSRFRHLASRACRATRVRLRIPASSSDRIAEPKNWNAITPAKDGARARRKASAVCNPTIRTADRFRTFGNARPRRRDARSIVRVSEAAARRRIRTASTATATCPTPCRSSARAACGSISRSRALADHSCFSCSRMKSVATIVSGLFLAAVACGGNVLSSGEASSNDDGVDGGSVADSGKIIVTPGCPSSLPNDGVACLPEGIHCEYGTSNGWCANPTADCTDGAWQQQPSPHNSIECFPSDKCPASYPVPSDIDASNGVLCGSEQLECDYPGRGRCVCISIGGILDDGGPAEPNIWRCDDPAPGCAIDRPRIGSACSTEGQRCFYGEICSEAVELTCTNGIWIGGGGC